MARHEGSVAVSFVIAVVGGVFGGLVFGKLGALAGAWIPSLVYALGQAGGEKSLTEGDAPMQRGATLSAASILLAALPAFVGSMAGFVAAALR